MCDFRPGDEVVCIEGAAGRFPELGWVCIAEGATYTIAEVWHEGEIGETGLAISPGGMVQLVEIGHVRSGNHCGFRASRFRKVQRPDLSAWLNTAAADTDGLDKPIITPARPKVDALLKRVRSGAFG